MDERSLAELYLWARQTAGEAAGLEIQDPAMSVAMYRDVLQRLASCPAYAHYTGEARGEDDLLAALDLTYYDGIQSIEAAARIGLKKLEVLQLNKLSIRNPSPDGVRTLRGNSSNNTTGTSRSSPERRARRQPSPVPRKFVNTLRDTGAASRRRSHDDKQRANANTAAKLAWGGKAPPQPLSSSPSPQASAQSARQNHQQQQQQQQQQQHRNGLYEAPLIDLEEQQQLSPQIQTPQPRQQIKRRAVPADFLSSPIPAPASTPPPKTLAATPTHHEATSNREAEALKNLVNVDVKLGQMILNEIVVKGDHVEWDDIAGLEPAKLALKEVVIYPFLRPDLFLGLREPARGVLLFGPPGTGKTMLARAVASESKCTFFSVSASSLTSKYLGESEKLVRALFALAKELAPSIIFVDEIDSLLSARGGGSEHEASRRLKTEFLVQWSSCSPAAGASNTGVLVLAATNLPWHIDEAARRRFVKRQYIPLPEAETRHAQLTRLISRQMHNLSEEDMSQLVEATNGYSGSDLTALAKDAALGPLRSLGDKLLTTSPDAIRPLGYEDFILSMRAIRPSVGRDNLGQYEAWNNEFGSSG